ncbi:MAG: hypothetical protein ACOKSU_21890 [Pseudomonas sp.]|uniref:hypothetical protein n=1 Tax=Pseudomonas TaxID=286 RepID=UPI0003C06D26|nr:MULTISPECIES: hypothetical protein [Pseudomonas]AGZ38112.1 hypothetical protein PVLB_26877 [Pseudomonas sp. VLB120]
MMIDAKPLLASLAQVRDARAKLADIADTQVQLQERDKVAALARYETYDREYRDAELTLRVASSDLVRNLEQLLAPHETAEADLLSKQSN